MPGEVFNLVWDEVNNGWHFAAGEPFCNNCGSWENKPSQQMVREEVRDSSGGLMGHRHNCGVCGSSTWKAQSG